MKGFGGNLQGLMKQAQKMQSDLQKAKEEIETSEVTGTSGGGAVKVRMSGDHSVKEVSIDPAAKDDLEVLQDMLVAAFNDASSQIKNALKDKMSKITGGMPIPGLF
jgi:DNA-binding YbaB/EbfC family protein